MPVLITRFPITYVLEPSIRALAPSGRSPVFLEGSKVPFLSGNFLLIAFGAFGCEGADELGQGKGYDI